jgi:hypothetical protein
MQYLENTRNTGAIIFGRLYFVHKSLQSPFFPTVAPFVCVCVFVCVFECLHAGKKYMYCSMQITVKVVMSSVCACSGQICNIRNRQITDSYQSSTYDF